MHKQQGSCNPAPCVPLQKHGPLNILRLWNENSSQFALCNSIGFWVYFPYGTPFAHVLPYTSNRCGGLALICLSSVLTDTTFTTYAVASREQAYGYPYLAPSVPPTFQGISESPNSLPLLPWAWNSMHSAILLRSLEHTP